jgi:hypothetical protein
MSKNFHYYLLQCVKVLIESGLFTEKKSYFKQIKGNNP